MKNKRTALIIGLILVLMAAAIGVLAYLNMPKTPVDTGTLTIVSGESTVKSYSYGELAALPYIEVQKDIQSGSHGNDSGLFRGVPLRTLLEGALQDKTKVLVYAQDGYTTTYKASEVLKDDSIFLAYSQNGERLKSLREGGVGPYRIIVSGDEFGTRFCKYVYKIEVQ